MLQRLMGCAVIISFAGLVGACVTQYSGPDIGGAPVTLEYRNSGPKWASFETYKDASACTDRLMLGRGLKVGEKKSISIQAGKEFAMSVGQDFGIKLEPGIGITPGGCVETVSFKPEPGKHYIFTFSRSSGQCSVSLVEHAAEGDSSIEHDVLFDRRDHITPLGEAGPFCKPRA